MTEQNPNNIKQKQYRNLLLVCGGVLLAIIVFYYFISGSKTSTEDLRNKKPDETIFVSPVEQIDTQSAWMERAQNKLKEQEKQTADLKGQLDQLKTDVSQKSIDEDPRFKEIVNQNKELLEQLKAKSHVQDQTIPQNEQLFSTTPGPRINQLQQQPSEADMGIDNDVLQLKTTNHYPVKNPDTYVPAGTFVKAIMLGAADASAGVSSQENPSPMLFRITADGTLPNHHQSHLKDCVATAAVVGDISSERGYIRLERLSCTFPNGEIVEQPVEGTVFGMDAKNGVRGNPLWREGALLERAAIAGTLAGLGGAISQTYTTNSISPLGATQTVNNGDIFKYGAAQGASNAMEKLADYNVKRAEQYHPVIQLSAGQSVDVVILKGFYLDGQKHDETITTQDISTTPAPLFPSSSQASGLTLSESELERIKQNEKPLGFYNHNQSGVSQ